MIGFSAVGSKMERVPHTRTALKASGKQFQANHVSHWGMTIPDNGLMHELMKLFY